MQPELLSERQPWATCRTGHLTGLVPFIPKSLLRNPILYCFIYTFSFQFTHPSHDVSPPHDLTHIYYSVLQTDIFRLALDMF